MLFGLIVFATFYEFPIGKPIQEGTTYLRSGRSGILIDVIVEDRSIRVTSSRRLSCPNLILVNASKSNSTPVTTSVSPPPAAFAAETR